MDVQAYACFRQRLIRLLETVTECTADMGYSALVAMGRDLVARINEERFYVSVLGEIKRGKSTLINAVLGEEILPKAAVVCTAALCIIRHGERPRAVLMFPDGTRQEIAPGDLALHATKKNRSASKLQWVEIEHPLPLLKDGVIIVDTPGVNDTDELRRKLTEEFIPRSDGVIFVLNAGQPFSDSELRFLKSSVLAYHIRKFWFVLNGMDRLKSEEERGQALSYCQDQLAKILPEARVFPVSARQHLAALAAHDERLAESGIPAFFHEVSADLVEGRREGLLEVPLARCGCLLDELQSGITWESTWLTKDEAQADSQVLTLERDLNRLYHEQEGVLDTFMATVESLVYEASKGAPSPSEEGLPEAICGILGMDEADSRKAQELAHLLNDRVQSYADSLADLLHARVVPHAIETGKDLASRVAHLDSRLSGFRGSVDEAFQFEVSARDLPETGLQTRNILATFGRFASLAFLFQGNVLLAGASLATWLSSRLSLDAARWVLPRFRECLAEAGEATRTRFLSQKVPIAIAYRQQLEEAINPVLGVLEQLQTNTENLRHASRERKDARKKALDAAMTSVAAFREDLQKLQREF